jgi:triacylglycerol lipase
VARALRADPKGLANDTKARCLIYCLDVALRSHCIDLQWAIGMELQTTAEMKLDTATPAVMVQEAPADCVILLHGLGRTAYSFWALERDLTRAGYVVVNQGYPSRRRALRDLIPYVERAFVQCACRAQTQQPGRPVRISFVTHSMGGILLRQFFASRPDYTTQFRLHRAVLLGPPNQGSEIVDQWRKRWYYRWYNGPAGQELGTDAQSAPQRLPGLPLEFAVIAGDAGQQNSWLPSVPLPHDGKVSVASTHLEGERAHLVLPINHTWLPSAKISRDHVAFFLQNGIFRSQ